MTDESKPNMLYDKGLFDAKETISPDELKAWISGFLSANGDDNISTDGIRKILSQIAKLKQPTTSKIPTNPIQRDDNPYTPRKTEPWQTPPRILDAPKSRSLRVWYSNNTKGDK